MNPFLRSRTFTIKALSYATVRTFAMESQHPARRFAPLSKGKGHDVVDGSMVLKGIVFDVDGTLCE
jgi:hypothetical protein